MTAVGYLCVRRPHPSHLDACAVTGWWAERGGGVWCRGLYNNRLTGTVPTELGTMDALTMLCVRRPHSSRLDACAVTGLGLSVAGVWDTGSFSKTVSWGRCRQSWATWT
jgi:hypothetical protein